MARSDSAINVLQWGERSVVHAILAEEGDGFRIEALHAREISGGLDGDTLCTFARETGLPNRAFVSILPRHEATLRILTLPSHDPAEIASMVTLGAEELAPYPREQLAIRHYIITRLPSGESRVLVVLFHQDVIHRHVQLLNSAGLEPGKIAFSTACLHALACASPEAPRGRHALAWISEDALEVVVMQDGVLEFSRGVAHHARWNEHGAAGQGALGYEIRDALAAYRRESDRADQLDELLVVSEVMDAMTLASDLEKSTGRPWRPAHYLQSLIRNEPESARGLPVMAAGAALLESGRSPIDFDFLPATLLAERAIRGARVGLRRVALLAAIVIALLLAAFGQSVYQRLKLIEELRGQVAAVAPDVQGVLDKQRGLRTIASQVDQGGNFLALLAAVAEAAPPDGFNITRVEYDRATGMNLWGRARTKDLVLGDFLGALRQLGTGSLAQLAQAHSQYETPGQERDQNIINYHISIPALTEEPADGTPAPNP